MQLVDEASDRLSEKTVGLKKKTLQLLDKLGSPEAGGSQLIITAEHLSNCYMPNEMISWRNSCIKNSKWEIISQPYRLTLYEQTHSSRTPLTRINICLLGRLENI